MSLGGIPLPNLKKGWFTRQCRKLLQNEWDAAYNKLGNVDRWGCRDAAWLKAANLGYLNIVAHLYANFKSTEANILRRNQQTLGEKIRECRNQDPQLQFIGMTTNRLSAALAPIAHHYVREPGVDKDFGSLLAVRDIDFDVLLDMVDVREENIDVVTFAKEDYEYIDKVRRRAGISRNSTLGQAFGF